MAGAPRAEADQDQHEPGDGLREPRLALIWLTAVVLCVAWIVFSRTSQPAVAPPWETGGQAAPGATGPPVQPLVETPKPAVAETTQTTGTAAAAAPEEGPKAPAPPVAVPEGVGFGPGLGSRVTPETDAKAAPSTDTKATPPADAKAAPAPETK